MLMKKLSKIIRQLLSAVIFLIGLFFLYCGFSGLSEISLISAIILILFGGAIIAFAIMLFLWKWPKRKTKPKSSVNNPPQNKDNRTHSNQNNGDTNKKSEVTSKEKAAPLSPAKTVEQKDSSNHLPEFVALAIRPDDYGEDIDEISAIRYSHTDEIKNLTATINHDARAFSELANFIGDLPIVVYDSEEVIPLLHKYLPNYYPPIYDIYEEPFDVYDLIKKADEMAMNCNTVSEECAVIFSTYVGLKKPGYKPHIKAGCASFESYIQAEIISVDDLIQKENLRVAKAQFLPEEQPYVSALKSLSCDGKIFISKNNNYIVMRAVNAEICRIKLNKTFTYILVPDDWVVDEWRLEKDGTPRYDFATNTDLQYGDYERVIISSPDQISLFSKDIQDAVTIAQRRLDVLPITWPYKQ